MTHRLPRKQRADWNRPYRRDYERDRAIEKLRNSGLVLVVGFVVLALAFASAWTK